LAILREAYDSNLIARRDRLPHAGHIVEGLSRLDFGRMEEMVDLSRVLGPERC
jgi:hypothetical protein